MKIIEKIAGTYESEIIREMDCIYKKIAEDEEAWQNACKFHCADGCGQCCVNFEPEIFDSEALFLAAWLLDNQAETAFALIDGTFSAKPRNSDQECIFFNKDSPYHCTVYNGRCCICRLFGFSGDRGKDGKKRFKPCRFYPESQEPMPFSRRQYTESELTELFGALPPAMSDIMENVISLTPETPLPRPLRETLPLAIRRILFLSQFSHSA